VEVDPINTLDRSVLSGDLVEDRIFILFNSKDHYRLVVRTHTPGNQQVEPDRGDLLEVATSQHAVRSIGTSLWSTRLLVRQEGRKVVKEESNFDCSPSTLRRTPDQKNHRRNTQKHVRSTSENHENEGTHGEPRIEPSDSWTSEQPTLVAQKPVRVAGKRLPIENGETYCPAEETALNFRSGMRHVNFLAQTRAFE
jgi:hypothetical protein